MIDPQKAGLGARSWWTGTRSLAAAAELGHECLPCEGPALTAGSGTVNGEQEMTTSRTWIPHHGPVSPDCPVECLLTVLSLMSFSRLACARDAPFSPPFTVGDVMNLYTRRQLRKIRGLGPRRISEIEAALVLAGLDLTMRQQQPADEERPAMERE